MRPIPARLPRLSVRRAAPRLLLLVAGAFARRAPAQVNPDINLYKTIEAQQVKPNIIFVTDTTGSMQWDMAGASTGSTQAQSATYRCVRNTTACGSTNSYRWEYQTGPSRMAVLKNVLGPYVPIFDDPARTPSACVASSSCAGVAQPALTRYEPLHLIDNNATKMNIGLQIFDAGQANYNTNLIFPNTTPAATGACEAQKADLYMNLYSASGATTQCSPNVTITGLATGGSTPTVAALYFSQLDHWVIESGTSMTSSFNMCPSGAATVRPTINYPAGWPAGGDPYRVCGRKLFSFLLTDGQSNYCNSPPPPASPDSLLTYPACSATAGNGNVAPYSGSPSVAANALYNNGRTIGGNYSIRSFVLGISNSLTGVNAVQELRYDAYFGRTDAGDPYGQGGLRQVQAYDSAGVKIFQDAPTNSVPLLYPADPYLRKSGSATASAGEYVVCDSINRLTGKPEAASIRTLTIGGIDYCSGTGYVCSHAYAYTATDQAQLSTAIQSALSAVAAGDYTTESPVISDNSAASSGTYIYTTSADYPGFAGHLRAQDLSLPLPGGLFTVVWDAGDLLSRRSPATRKIYTYNAGALVQITGSSVLPGISANGIDFLLGYDGTLAGRPRSWALGDMTHSPPVVVTPPGAYLQGTTTGHDVFETTWARRTRLVLAGSSDGMVHAFNAVSGAEEWAFVPPNLLATIEQQYKNFSAPVPAVPVGQPTVVTSHLYGVASALNLIDVDVSATATPDWRTLMVGGLGAGGKALFALDVTRDVATAVPPFNVLWYKDSASLPGLGNTWSSPSIALARNGKWVVSAGSGPDGANGNSGYTNGVTAYHLNAADGAILKSYMLGTAGSETGALVRATTFPNHSAYSTGSIAFADAIANRFYQADTLGRIWDTDASATTATSWAPVQASYLATPSAELQQPIYDAPTAGLYKDTYSPAPYRDHFLQIMSWASGSFFEERLQVNDPNCGPSPKDGIPCFSENLYSRFCDLTSTPAAGCSGGFTTRQTPITGLSYTIGAAPASYSKFARAIGSPLLFIPVLLNSTGSTVVTWPQSKNIASLYTIYDPTPTGVFSCKGESSVIVNFPFGASSTTARDAAGAYGASSNTIIDAGAGAASAAVVYGGRIIVNVSSTTEAGARDIGATPITPPVPAPVVGTWREVF